MDWSAAAFVPLGSSSVSLTLLKPLRESVRSKVLASMPSSILWRKSAGRSRLLEADSAGCGAGAGAGARASLRGGARVLRRRETGTKSSSLETYAASSSSLASLRSAKDASPSEFKPRAFSSSELRPAAAAISASMLISDSPSSESGITLLFFDGRLLLGAELVELLPRLAGAFWGAAAVTRPVGSRCRVLLRDGAKRDEVVTWAISSCWRRRASLASLELSVKSSSSESRMILLSLVPVFIE